MITPAAAAAAAGVGLAGGLALVTLRARGAAREVETYNRLVATTGRGSPTSIGSIQAENARLSSIGVSSSDAAALRLQVARSSAFTGQTERTITLAQNLGQVLGTDASSALDRLEQAAKGSAEGMGRLALEVGAVSREAAQLAIDAGSGADSFGKMSDMATALERHLQDYASKNIDPISKAATELSTNWSNMLVTLGNTINFEGIVVGAFGAMGAAVDHLAARVQNLKNFLTGNWSAIGPEARPSSPEWRFPIPGATRPKPGVPPPKPTVPGASTLFLPPVKVTATPRGGRSGGGGGSSRAVTDPNRGLTDFSGGGEAEADLRAETVQLEKQLALVQAETALQGQSAAYIDQQLALLKARQLALSKARQEVEKSGLDTTNETAASYLKLAEALVAGRLHLEQIQVESRRWDDAVRGLASTMENTLGNTIEDIFSDRRITDWGAQLKSVVGSVLSEIVKFTLIRPAIGLAARSR